MNKRNTIVNLPSGRPKNQADKKHASLTDCCQRGPGISDWQLAAG
jgi:hypothetical protein